MEARRSMAVRGTVVARIIPLTFALAGKPLLAAMGISLPALRIGAAYCCC